MTVRRCLFWLHLTAGVFAGVVILIMSVTGVALMYEKQMLAWVDKDTRVAPAADSVRLPMETLLANVRDAKGATPSTITVRSDRTEPTTVALREQGTWYVNPYTAEFLGQPSTSARGVFRSIEDWHRWLATSDRSTGRAVTGASNLAFLFLVCSGLYIWLPRKWKWQNFRSVMLFRGGLSGKARDFNWHNAAGFWCCVPLFFVVLSGVVMSYPWASDMVYRAGGSEPPAQGKGKGGGRGGRPQQAEVDLTGLNQLLARAEQYAAETVPQWRTFPFQIPPGARGPASFTIDASNGGQPQKRGTLQLNRETAAIENWETYDRLDKGRQYRTWMRFMHTGEYYGLAGQTVAGIASAGGALLVWTGIALAIRRLRARIARSRSAEETASARAAVG